jgi:hypothetical protein
MSASDGRFKSETGTAFTGLQNGFRLPSPCEPESDNAIRPEIRSLGKARRTGNTGIFALVYRFFPRCRHRVAR